MLNFYYGEECPHCHHMMPLVDKLIGEGREIQKFETWHNEEHAAMLEKADGGVVVVCRFFTIPTPTSSSAAPQMKSEYEPGPTGKLLKNNYGSLETNTDHHPGESLARRCWMCGNRGFEFHARGSER